MTDQLTALDATFLELEEADESAHMHIGAVMVFAPGARGVPKLQAVRAQLGERLGALPRYRQRLSHPHTGGLHWPTWLEDPAFAIEDHVRHAALPGPGSGAQLLEWAGTYWSQRLDRQRPLWDAVLLEGLEGGGWAIATKTHHAIVDGIGSVDVGHLLLDTSRRPSRWEPPPRPAPTGATDPQSTLRRLPGAVAGTVRAGVGAALHPRRLFDEARAMLELILRDEVVAAPSTSLNVPLGTLRRYEVVTAELGEIKAIKNALGGTVNDVVLALATGGLRRLLLSRGEKPPSSGLRAMVPVNVRAAEEHLRLGNKITSLFVHLPVAEPEPLRRYGMTVGEAEALKSGSQAMGGATLVALTSMAPPALHSTLARSLFASRLFNVTVTNVPGPQQPLYAFGSRMEEVYPLVPLAAEHAVGIAVVSYAGRMFFGLIGDDRAAADLAVLRAGIAESLAELRQLAAEGEPGVTGRPAAHT